MARLSGLAAYRAQQRARAVGAGLVGKLTSTIIIAQRALATGASFSRSSSGLGYDAAGNRLAVGANQPRYSADGSQYFEAPRSNLYRNPAGEGGGANVAPTYWTLTGSLAGVTADLSFGTEANGTRYAQITFSGTASANNNFAFLSPESAGIAVTPGQVLTFSHGVKSVGANALPASANLRFRVTPWGSDSTNGTVTEQLTPPGISDYAYSPIALAPVRDVDVAFRVMVYITLVSGTSYDGCSIRFADWQAENGLGRTSPIMPPAGSTGTSTRATEMVTIPVGAAAGLTVLGGVTVDGTQVADQVLWQVDDGSDANSVAVMLPAYGLAPIVEVRRAGSVSRTGVSGFLTAGVRSTIGLRFGSGRAGLTIDGRAIAYSDALTLPPGLSTLRVGNNAAGTKPATGRVAVMSVVAGLVAGSALRAATGSGTMPGSVPPSPGGLDLGGGTALRDDPQRPVWHGIMPYGFQNDPNGAIYDATAGLYRLAAQWNPRSALQSDYNLRQETVLWGELVSADKVRWKLAPNPIMVPPNLGTNIKRGQWSGDRWILPNGKALVVHTVPSPEVVYMALAPSPSSAYTQKLQPVITASAPSLPKTPTTFRDPALFALPDGTGLGLIMSVGNATGWFVPLYTATWAEAEAGTWTYRNILVQYDASTPNASANATIECALFKPIGNSRWLFTYSAGGRTYYQTGTFTWNGNAGTFGKETQDYLDWAILYASNILTDANGAAVGWSWVRDTKDHNDQQTARGWAGHHSAPRVFSVDTTNGNRLVQTPDPALQTLRGVKSNFTGGALFNGLEVIADPINAFEIEVLASGAGRFALDVTATQNGQDVVIASVIYDAAQTANNRIRVQPRNYEGDYGLYGVPLVLDSGETVTLRIFTDGKTLELCANDRSWATVNTYFQGMTGPFRVKATDVSGATSMGAWRLAPISSDRLTT
ncbi:hypothetical protein ACI2KH_17055 [Roseomonas mucosa]|uniref:hypothetical protein n=1 Tax=Roseomonas mucosa TaxID=207340 RepID=UPI00384FD17F